MGSTRHTNVPQYRGALGRWVKAQREHKKQTELTDAGVVFPPGKKLPACLPPDRIAKLDSIGFQWKVNTIVGWENRYQQLLEYRRQHGDVHVPQAYPEDVAFVSIGDDLLVHSMLLRCLWRHLVRLLNPLFCRLSQGRWVMVSYIFLLGPLSTVYSFLATHSLHHTQRQRVQYHLMRKGKPSTMTEERIAKLEAIGFAWVAPGFHQKGQKTGKRKRGDEGSEVEASSDEENDMMEPAPVAQIPYYHHHHHHSPHQYQFTF